jgi:molybdate-binding protein/transcriptional regulator with XRE-family HTH domain
MKGRLSNTLAAERERLGWSQARMAEAAGVSRQSYAAVESGSSVPSTEVALRLSEALGRPVGELFRLPDRPTERRTAAWSGAAGPAPGDRVRLTRIGGRWIAHPSAESHRREAPADGRVASGDAQEVRVELFPDAPPPSGLAVVGCDPAFGIVADELRRERGIEVSWSQRGSRAALVALARGEAHMAGVHLLDLPSGRWNEASVRELVPFSCTRVTFAAWEQGLLVRPDARRRIDGIGDLADGRARLLNREPGSGSRALLDDVLAEAGVEPATVEGYGTTARSHLSVADGIAAGAADAGVAILAAGRARGLEVLPLREEAYELVIPDHFLDLPDVDALLDALRRPGIRAQVEALGGYDGAGMGSVAS